MHIWLHEVGCEREEFNEPLGLGLLAAVAQSKSAVDSVTCTWRKLQQDISWSTLGTGDIVGVSLQIDSLAAMDLLYNDYIATKCQATLVVGNLLPTYATSAVLERFPRAICVVGEAETSFGGLIDYLADGSVGNPDAVPGLAFIGVEGLVRTHRVPTLLSNLPPASRPFLAEIHRRGGIVRIEGSRGCHWGKCQFCSVSERFGEGVWRPFPVNYIVDELIALSGAGILSPYFSDEDFFGREYARSEELAIAILRAKKRGRIDPDMNFFCSVLASDLRDQRSRPALDAWREAGLRELFVGIEAGDNLQLRFYGKKARGQTNCSAVEVAQEFGFQLDIGFIMFEPNTTIRQLESNIAFLRGLDLSECDSRVVKHLRIQPLTGFESIKESFGCGDLDLSSLTYPYTFRNDGVQLIWDSYQAATSCTRAQIDRLLATARGEVESEKWRLQMKKMLARIRDADLDVLDQLIQLVKAGVSDRAGLLDGVANGVLDWRNGCIGDAEHWVELAV